jgi:hypothetical protein
VACFGPRPALGRSATENKQNVRYVDFTFIVIDVGQLILSGQTVEVTV